MRSYVQVSGEGARTTASRPRSFLIKKEPRMNTTEQGLIKLEGVTKVFYTDEVETHALSGVHLEIKNG